MKLLRALFIFAALVAVGMGVVALRTETRQAGYLMSCAWKEQQDLKRMCLELDLELAQLRSPQRLETESRRLELGLCPPGQDGWSQEPVVARDR